MPSRGRSPVRQAGSILPCWVLALTSAAVWAATEPAVPSANASRPLAPLPLELPLPVYIATPSDIPMSPHIEPFSDKLRPPFLAPQGTRLISLDRPVSCSDPNPINGSPDLVTDGTKDAGDSNVLELHRRLQWAQIDLGSAHAIYAIVVWHPYDMPQVVHDVVVQVATDRAFTDQVRTLFNNDYDNSAGLGVGGDKEYFATHQGRLIDAAGQVARYVRVYSQGSTYTALNRLIEVEVYGLPAPAGSPGR